jgi:hypothetical protein
VSRKKMPRIALRGRLGLLWLLLATETFCSLAAELAEYDYQSASEPDIEPEALLEEFPEFTDAEQPVENPDAELEQPVESPSWNETISVKTEARSSGPVGLSHSCVRRRCHSGNAELLGIGALDRWRRSAPQLQRASTAMPPCPGIAKLPMLGAHRIPDPPNASAAAHAAQHSPSHRPSDGPMSRCRVAPSRWRCRHRQYGGSATETIHSRHAWRDARR